MAALAAGMMYNVQVFESENISGLSLISLENIAFALNENNDGDDKGGLFWKKKYHRITCGPVSWQKTTFKDANGSIVGKTEYINGQLIASYSGSYTTSIFEDGYTSGYRTEGWNCIDGWDYFTCTSCTNPCIGC